MTKIAVGICDRNQLFREGIQSLLRSTPFVVTSTAEHIGALFDEADQGGRPELIICCLDTLVTLNAELADRPWCRIGAPRLVVLTNSPGPAFLAAASGFGVHAVLSRNISADVLQRALGLVMLGQRLFPAPELHYSADEDELAPVARLPSASIAAPSLAARSRPSHLHLAVSDDQTHVQLSERETQILRCLVDGLPNKLIARNLAITEATVKVHIKGLLRKLRVSNRTQAAVWGMNNPIATAPRIAPIMTMPDPPVMLRLAT